MWAFQLRPAPQELLSSYLTRVAHAHGSTAGAFCRRHLHDSWYWTRDVDRGVAVSQHARLAALAGMSVAQVREMTLRNWMAALTPGSYRGAVPAAVTPWLAAVGIDQARRRHGALSYCPICLEHDGVAIKAWRLVFHTHCAVHGRALLDSCSRCSAPFVPHLSRRTARHCFACGHGLLNSEKSCAVAAPNEGARRMQALMQGWLEGAGASDPQARDRMHGLRVLTSLCWRGRSDRATGERGRVARLETLPVAVRVQAMGWLHEFVSSWPESFRAVAPEQGLTQRTFARLGVSGQWLLDEVERLPLGQSRFKSRRFDALVSRLRSPARGDKDAMNWRATRARVLMLEACRGR